MMNTCYFCNQEKKKTLEHLEGYIRINKQVRAVCFNANLWVQRKKGREKEEENGRRQRSQLIKMLVLLSTALGFSEDLCVLRPPTGNCTPVQSVPGKRWGRRWGKRRKQSLG